MAFDRIVNRILGASLRSFGEAVTFLPASGGGYRISGIFREQFTEIDAQTGAVVSSNKPNLGIRLADFLSAPTAADQVVVGSLKYRIIDVQEDGDGGATLILHKLTAYLFTADNTTFTADISTITADAQ